jgi:hypothetical protein
MYVNPKETGSSRAVPAVVFSHQLRAAAGPIPERVLSAGLIGGGWGKELSTAPSLSREEHARVEEVAERLRSSFLVGDNTEMHYGLDFLRKAGEGQDFGAPSAGAYEGLDNIHELVQNEKKWIRMRLHGEIRRLGRPKFILKKIDSRMRVNGLLASELCLPFPGRVIGVWQRWKNRYHCEIRRGAGCRADLAALVGEIAGRAELLSGGGRAAAAGFTAKGGSFFKALDLLKHRLGGACSVSSAVG